MPSHYSHHRRFDSERDAWQPSTHFTLVYQHRQVSHSPDRTASMIQSYDYHHSPTAYKPPRSPTASGIVSYSSESTRAAFYEDWEKPLERSSYSGRKASFGIYHEPERKYRAERDKHRQMMIDDSAYMLHERYPNEAVTRWTETKRLIVDTEVMGNTRRYQDQTFRRLLLEDSWKGRGRFRDRSNIAV
ncbi:unnamed protein product [Periconia digitata]|uniref:Uncharacterized protein n=1 Tax=Periconia digitata TaxID=1303443 RepID=A0A9W4UU78_9PLEO|nr:unnamed protein product [Periconia digitata]